MIDSSGGGESCTTALASVAFGGFAQATFVNIADDYFGTFLGAALGNGNAGSPQQSRTTPPVVGQQSPAREAQCAYALQAAIFL